MIEFGDFFEFYFLKKGRGWWVIFFMYCLDFGVFFMFIEEKNCLKIGYLVL